MNHIGRRVRAIDWDERTSGRSRYTADHDLEGMLTGRVLRSPYPHARIVAIDTAAASAMIGVHAVVTCKDLAPGMRYLHEGAADRPALADGVVRFIGQEVAAVAAETPRQAEAALRAIRIEYERLAAPLTPDDALLPDAAKLHDRGTPTINLAKSIARHWGEPEPGRSASEHHVAGVFSYPRIAHACMETHSTAARWDHERGSVHLWTSSQAPYYVVKEVAHALGLQTADVICHEVAVGGGFGAKSKICEQEVIAALLARNCRRPVLVALSRNEEFQVTKTRHAIQSRMQVHGDSAGRLRAIDADLTVDNGAYNHSGVSVTAVSLKALGMIYRPDGVAASAKLVDTAKTPGGQFRGYGSTQSVFALESLIDELAERQQIDPIEWRIRNANEPFSTTLAGGILSSARLVECLEAVREAIGWDHEKAHRQPDRGVGVAAALHPSGSFAQPGANRGDCAIDIFLDSRARVRFGGADAGTGQRTILAQIAAEELGLPIDKVEVLSTESDQTPFDMGAWSSRGTYFSGHACRLAATRMAEQLKARASARCADQPARLERGMAIVGDEEIPLGALLDPGSEVLSLEASFVEPDVEMPSRETGKGNVSGTYSFCAHAAVVEVDRRTGVVRIVDYVAAHDVGRALNPTLAEGQIVGATAMGLGAALREELITEQGKLVNGAYLNYALPRAADLPRIRPILIEGGDAKGPYGAKAVGEVGINPPAPAIANAIYDAIGIRFRELPITPDKILAALAEREGRRRDHLLWRRPHRWWIALVRWAYPRGLLKVLHHFAVRSQPVAAAMNPCAIEMPADLAAALKLHDSGSMFIGGGTDVQAQRRQGIVQPVRLISTLDIAAMDQVAAADGKPITIGGAARLAQVADALKERCPAIADTIAQIASPQIRAMATVAGNLLQAKQCWFYRNDFPCYKRAGPTAPCYAVNGDHRFYHAAIDGHRCQAVTPSDLATVLMAFDATVTIEGLRAKRPLSIAELYTGPGESALRPDELLTSVEIPVTDERRHVVFEKLGLWQGDFAVAAVAVAATIDDAGRWHDIRLVIGGVAPVPRRLRGTEIAMEGAVASVRMMRTAIDDELDRIAHPLERNGWKLDAVAGLAEKAVERLSALASRGDSVAASNDSSTAREEALAAAK